jgi:hypothetical protein
MISPVPCYEYELVTLPKPDMPPEEVRDFLNNWGLAGWELCAMGYGMLIFKRLK